MSLHPQHPFALQPSDQRLLHLVARIVPADDREDWSRAWHAELWHLRNLRNLRHVRDTRDARHSHTLTYLSWGIARDALWLRAENIRLRLQGTPTLCLASLSGITLLSAAVGIGAAGNLPLFSSALAAHLNVSLTGGVLVAFVAWATTFRRNGITPSSLPFAARLHSLLFCAIKGLLVWTTAFLLSTAIFLPLHRYLPISADLFQVLDLVIFTLSGLRWAFADQAARCRQCLHSLTPPARIGRPSRNLLEWNGTELSCRHGHGVLSVPELETSWSDAGRWVQWSES